MRLFVVLLLVSVAVKADQISLPNTLSNNTVANAENVQANFDTLLTESNENDSRIGDLEGIAAVIGDLNANLSIGGGLQHLTLGSPKPYSGALNTAVGIEALEDTSSGYYNTAVGYRTAAGNTTGYFNTAVGYIALGNNSTGAGNTAVGNLALYGASLSPDSGSSQNSALGDHALYNNSGFGNTAVGAQSLRGNTTGSQNDASGYRALYNNTTGYNNTASGFEALVSNDAGNSNVAIGHRALLNNIGTGSGNTGVGASALLGNFSGLNNTAVGYGAGVSSPGLENATAIGYGATVDASNKIQLGNAQISLVETEGGLQAAEGQFMVSTDGDVTASNVTADSVSTTSDARLKETIRSLGLALGLINDLNPVSYHRTNNPEGDIEMGLLAQEVEATLEKHGLGNSGMVHQPNEDAYMSLRYNDLLAPMIKAIQELDEKNQTLEAQLNSQLEKLLTIVQSQQEQIAQLQQMVEHQFAAR